MTTTLALDRLMKAETIEDGARAFANWLNFEGELEDLFRYVVKLTGRGKVPPFNQEEMGWILKVADKQDPSDPEYVYKNEVNRIIAGIEKKYPSRLQIVSWKKSGLPKFARMPIPPLRSDSLAACVVLDVFEQLARNGFLAAIRWCEHDDAPFFSRRRKRRYCCDECQRTHYGQSSERKKDNLEYQKTYYHEWLSAEAKRMQKLAARLGVRGNLPLSDLKKKLKGR
jgi:hypothetical protein